MKSPLPTSDLPSPLRRHLPILALYTILTLVLTWPLVSHFTTHVPGVAQWAFDESTFVWNIWYFKHALVDQLASPLHTELIWYPLGIDLILYTYNFFHAIFAQPAAFAVNLPFGSNLALVISTILSGYGTFLLVRYLLGRGWSGLPRLSPGARLLAAFGAGLLYAFGSNRAIYATLGHYDMVTTQWIPFYALSLLRALDGALTPRRRRQAALWAGLFMALNGLAEMITALFLAIFTAIVLLIIVIAWLTRRNMRAGTPKATLPSLIVMLVLTGVAAFIIWSPALLPILNQFLTSDFSLEGWGEAIPLSVDALGFLKPTVLHPLWGSDLVVELRRVMFRAQGLTDTGFQDINTVFLGWTASALALLALIRYRRRVSIWGWTALTFGLFCLGPFLQINGRFRFDLDGVEATFPLPFVLLHYLPIIKANRAPNRNSVLLMLALAVLVGYGLAWILQTRRGQEMASLLRRPQSWVAGLLCGLLVFEHLALPIPLSDARIPTVYQTIAADPAPISVLQVPLGWRNSFGTFGPEATILQYYQTAHGKPMLGGNISRAPEFKMDYFKRIPFFAVMREIQFGAQLDDLDPALVAAAQDQAASLLYLYNTTYVLLYPPIPDRPPYSDTWQATWDYVKSTLPLEAEPFWAEDGIEAYRVVLPAGNDVFHLDLGAPDTYAYRGEGWDSTAEGTIYDATAIWATQDATSPASRVFVPLRDVDPAVTYQVTTQLRPFAYPNAPQQTVALTLNGTPYASQTALPDWQILTWEVPGAMLIDGLNRLELTWGYSAVPRVVIGGDRAISNTGVQLPIDADITAFADGGYIALYDEEGTQIDASAGRRGINVTVLDPVTGEVVEMRGFDTAASSNESLLLTEYLAAIPAGQIALFASYGDAWQDLTPAALDALQGFGVNVSQEEMQGSYLAAVGVQGAGPGSGAWVIDANNAFLRISLNRDQRHLAAAVDWVNVEQVR